MRALALGACVLAALSSAADLRIVDAHGRPIGKARVTLLLESQARAVQVFGDEPLVAFSDDRGTVPFQLPRIAGATVVIDHERYAPSVVTFGDQAPPDVLALDDGFALAGRLAGDGAVSAGGGTVCAIRTVPRPNGHLFEVRRCADVDADGSWTIRALGAGPHRLDVAVPAYLPLSRNLTLPSSEPWTGTLEPGHRAEVNVVDVSGRPAAGATVDCDGAVPSPVSADGHVRVALPHPVSPCRALGADGSESAKERIDSGALEPQTLALRPARLATGIWIADHPDDLLEPRFTLLGEIGTIGQSARTAESLDSSDGAFRIRLPPSGSFALRVEGPGFVPVTTDWFSLPQGGGTVDLGVLLLKPGAGIRGRVILDSTQEPLAGAVVTLEAQGRARVVLGRMGQRTTVTGSDGSFRLAGLGIGSYRMRVVWRDLPPLERAVDLREEEISSLDAIALHQDIRVSGIVTRDEHRPVADAHVELIPARLYDADPVATAATDAAGAFGPVPLAPGTYRLRVRNPDILTDQEIEVPAGEDALDLDVTIRSTRLTGIIRENGVPVSGGEVLLQRQSAMKGNLGVAVAHNISIGAEVWSGRSDTQFSAPVGPLGTFTIDDVPVDRMVLQYFGPSTPPVTRAIDVPDKENASIIIDVDGWTLQGRVDDGELASGLIANLALVSGDGTPVFRGSTSAAGNFAIDRLAPGTYDLVASAEGYQSSEAMQIVIGHEAPIPQHIRLAKAADATLDLVLLREASVPAAGVAVSIVDAVGRQLRAFPTWPDGRLHVTGLPPGKVYLIWSDPLAGVGSSSPISLRSGTQNVTLHLEPGKDLVVRCEALDCSGSRVGALSFVSEHGIDLAPFLSRGGAAVYSNRGAAYLGRLAPGSYNISASAGAFVVDRHLELAAGPGEVDLLLAKP